MGNRFLFFYTNLDQQPLEIAVFDSVCVCDENLTLVWLWLWLRHSTPQGDRQTSLLPGNQVRP